MSDTRRQRPRRQSAAVYRRRRLVALVLVLVVLGLVVTGVWALVNVLTSGATATPPVSQTDASLVGPSTEPSADPSGDPSGEPSPSADATPSADPTETPGVQECAAASLVLTATTDKQEYAAGEIPQLGMSLQNTGTTDCIIDVGTAQQTFTITSGADVWWRSTDCQAEPSSAIVTLAAGASIATDGSLGWDRSRSSTETCESDTRPRAPGGGASYYLTVSLGEVTSTTPVQIFLY